MFVHTWPSVIITNPLNSQLDRCPVVQYCRNYAINDFKYTDDRLKSKTSWLKNKGSENKVIYAFFIYFNLFYNTLLPRVLGSLGPGAMGSYGPGSYNSDLPLKLCSHTPK